MNADQLMFLMRAYNVKRYHTADVPEIQTVGDHTARVALLTVYLTGGNHLVWPALLHDGAEDEVGDVNAHAKRKYPYLNEAVDHAEATAFAEIGLRMPDLTEEDEAILKVADKLDLVLFGMKMDIRGDQRGAALVQRVMGYINEMKLPLAIHDKVNYLFDAIGRHYGRI